MMQRIVSAGLAVFALLLPVAHAQNTEDGLLVAAGAGYRRPVTELLEGFTQTSGIRAEGSFGNMRQIEAQVRQNPDIAVMIGDRVFLEPTHLAEHWQFLGAGKLVLVAAKGQPLQSIDDLRDARFARIALPDRERAVYGRAATLCLERLGLAQVLAERLLEVQTVPQVGAYLSTGEVDAGFVFGTDAAIASDKVRRVLSVTTPQPVRYPIALTNRSNRGAHAQALQDFILSGEGQAILAKFGFKSP